MADLEKIGLGLDIKVNKQQLIQLRTDLINLQKLTTVNLLKSNPNLNYKDAEESLMQIKASAQEVQSALSKAFNPKLGTANLTRLKEEFSHLNMDKIYEGFQKAGSAGTKAFNQIPSAVMKTNLQLKESHSLLDRIGDTMTNSLKWGLTSRVVNSLANSIQGAWNYTKALDTSLNDIRIVTNKSANEMERFAIQANRAAQDLGSSTKDYTNAALIYYQQGLGDVESQKRAEITLKTANVTGQSGREVSEQLTAIWNGYKVTANEAELYIDKVAKVAAGTAADLEEMATGMSKVAAAASNAGVDIDQLNATLATVVSVTREAPETIGSSFKTIYARLGDLKLGGTDEDGISLGKVSGQLQDLGIQILTDNGDLRDMGDIVEDIGNKWQDWSRAQQQAAAIAMAGKMQYSRLIALFDNWDDYNKALDMSVNAMGTLQEQQDIYMESTQAHLNKLSSAWERVFDAFVDNKGVNNIVDILANLVNGVGTLFEALGGGGNVVATLGSIFTQVFSRQIAESINTSIKNTQAYKHNLKQLEQQLKLLQEMQTKIGVGKDLGLDARIAERTQLQDRLKNKSISIENAQKINGLIDDYGVAISNQQAFNQRKNETSVFVKNIAQENGIQLSDEETEKVLYGNKDATKEFDKILKQNDETLIKYRKDLDALKDAQNEYKKAIIKLNEAEEKFGENSKEAQTARSLAAKTGSNVKSKVKTITQDLKKSSQRKDIGKGTKEDLNETIKIYDDLNQKMQEFPLNVKKNVKDIGEVINDTTSDAVVVAEGAFTDIEKDFQNSQDKIKDMQKDLGEGMEQEVNGAVKHTKDELNEAFKDSDREVAIQGITNAMAGLSQMVMAVSNGMNIFKIATDSTLDSWEKFSQISMNIITSAPLLINGAITFGKSLKSISIGFGFVTAEELAAAKAAGKFGVALWSAIWPVLAIMAMVAASIAVIVVMGNAMADAYNKTANAAKEANHQVEMLTEAYQRCKQAADDLKKSISDYTDGVNALENLIKGTDEYRKALEKANEAANALIEKYGLIAGIDYTIDSEGLIRVKTGEGSALENKQNEFNNQMNTLNQQQLGARLRAAQNSIDSQTLEYQRAVGIDYNSAQEKQYKNTISDMHRIPIVGPLLALGGQLGRMTSEERGYKIDTSEAKELREAFAIAGEDYTSILSQSDESVRQWILNNDNLSQSVKDDVDAIVKEKQALIGLIASTEGFEKTIKEITEKLNITHIENNKEINDKINDMSKDKDGQIDTNKANLIQKALSASEGGQALAHSEKSSYDLARIDANEVKSNKDLTDYINNHGMNAEELGLTDLNDKKSAQAYLKYVLGYSDEDIAHIHIDDQYGKTTAKWDSNYVDSMGVSHNSSDEIYSELNDEEARSTTAYQIKIKQLSEMYDGFAADFLNDSTDAIQSMMKDTQELSNQYGIDFSNIILNSMAGRTDSKNAALDFSEAFETLTDDDIEKLINLSPEGLQEALHMTEDDFWNLGYEGAAAFEEAFDQALFEKERVALLQLMNDINSFGRNGTSLSDDQLNNLSFGISSKLNATQMQDLSSNQLALSQIDFNTDNIDDVTEKLAFMSKTINEAKNNGIALTQAQKEEAKELNYSEDALKAYAEELRDSNKALKDNGKAAADIALANIRMNKGIETLQKNWEDWEAVLKEGNKNSGEYYEVLSQLKNAATDMFGVEVSNSFVENAENMQKLKELADGNVEAFDDLHDAAMRDYIAHLGIIGPDQETIDGIRNELITMIEDIQSQSNIEIGTELDSKYVDQLNEMLEKGQITEEQMNKILGGIGYSPTVSYKTVPGPTTRTEHNVKAKIGGSEIPLGTVVDYSQSDVQVPQIDGGSKTGGTGPTYIGKPSSSGINYSNGAGQRASKGGSSSKPSQEKPMEKEKDPYHDVNIELKLIESNLKMIQSQNDKAFGAKKIENYNKQLQLLNNKLDTTKEKLKIAESEQNRLGKELAARGAKFNSDGTIANYAQLYEQQLAKVNAIIEKYNNMSKDEQDAYKETLDEAKDDFSKFEEQLKDYDDTVSNLIPGLKQDLQDVIDEEIEINIKKFNMEFEIRLDMAEAQKDWNEFKKKILDDIDDDDILGNAKARARDDLSVYLDENGKGMLAAGTKQTNEILNELAKMDSPGGWSDVYGDDRTSALEDLQEAYQNIEESLLEIDAIQEDVFQAWLDTMDDISDKMQTQLDYYDQISSIIEHDQEVIKLVYGETDFEALGKMYELQHKNNLDLLDFRKQQVAFWENEMNAIEDKDSEAWQKARDNWMSAVSDLNSSIEDSINLIREKMENTIDGIFDKLNKDITNGKGLDYLEQQWDLINDVSEDYLDNVNAAFGLRDLERKYQNAIDNTDNVSAQRKLNALMEKELGELRDKDKLTEYDLERAQKRYELELKRMALEEAQNTKTKMRLRRDSQGNYRYEYVADEDNIAKLREEVDQLENSLYNFDKERFISLQNDIIGYIRDREDAIKEIQMDATLTEEERQNRILEITDLYNQKIQDITDQTVTAQNNLYQSGADELNKIWTQEGQDFQALSNEEQRIMIEEMVPQFTSGVHDMIEAFSGEGGFEARTKESMAALSQATLDYQTDLEAIQIASGETFDEVEQGLDKNIPKTEQLVDDTDKLYDSYQDELQAIKDVNAQLDKQIQKYQQIAEAAKNAATEAYNYWKQQQEMAANASAKDKVENQNTSDKGTNNTTNSTSSGGSSSGGPGHGGGDYTVISGDTLSGLALRFGGNADKWTDIYNKNKSIIDSVAKSKGYSTGGHWIFPGTKLYIPFRSGGYTGDWEDDNGRLAVLHKKELVLNANDTANMLDMMKIARDVIASAGPNLNNISAGTYNGSGDGSLEQNVHIEANFPNVESANEIEEAINNLVNLAAQRANRKIR